MHLYIPFLLCSQVARDGQNQCGQNALHSKLPTKSLHKFKEFEKESDSLKALDSVGGSWKS